ncbi:MAG: acylglycerol kinase family protein [bacterium]
MPGSGGQSISFHTLKVSSKKKQFACDLHVTSCAGHAVDIVREVDFANYDGLVAAGGDGTLFEVINGYFQNASSKRIPLSVLPVGTGNAFARELDALSWEKAIGIILSNKRKRSMLAGCVRKAETCIISTSWDWASWPK